MSTQLYTPHGVWHAFILQHKPTCLHFSKKYGEAVFSTSHHASIDVADVTIAVPEI